MRDKRILNNNYIYKVYLLFGKKSLNAALQDNTTLNGS